MPISPQLEKAILRDAKAKGATPEQIQKMFQIAEQQYAASTPQAPVGPVNPKPVLPAAPVAEPKKSFLQKAAGVAKTVGNALISSEKGVGESLSSGLIPSLPSFKAAQEANQGEADLLSRIAQQIRDKKAKGEDVTKLTDYYKRAAGDKASFDYEEVNPASTKSNQAALSEVAGVGLDIATAGTYGTAAKTLKTGQLAAKTLPSVAKTVATALKAGGDDVLKAAGKGALNAVKTGAPVGAAYGAVEASKQDGDFGDIAVGALKGAATGAVVSGAIGAVSGAAPVIASKLKKNFKDYSQKVVEQKAKESLERIKAAPDKLKEATLKKAKSQGVDEVAVTIMDSSEDDLKVFREMVLDAKKAAKDPIYAVKNRTIDKSGNSLLKTVPVLKTARDKAGEKIGEIVDKLPNKATSTQKIYDTFTKEIRSSGVTLDKNGKLNFSKSEFANDGTAKKLFQQLFDDLKPNKKGVSELAPKTINIIRRRLGNDTDLSSKLGAVPMGNNADRILKTTNYDLGKILEQFDPALTGLNDEYSELSSILSRMNKQLGRDTKLGTPQATRKAGLLMRRLESNSNPEMLQIVEELPDLLKRYAPEVKDDLIKQAWFARKVEDLYGLKPSNSLGGELQQAAEKNLQAGIGVAEDIANQNFGNIAGKIVMGGYRKIKGISPEKQQAFIDELLGIAKKAALPKIK